MLRLFIDKEKCCGCSACKSICPKGAIIMNVDEKGFLYPEIDVSECIDCMKCVAVCAFGKKELLTQKDISVFAVKHKNYDTRMLSSSGGAFTLLSDEILKEGGIVYGCVLSRDNQAIHMRADTFEGRNRMRGTKYIQSDLKNSFLNVQNDLEMGKKVMFTGTPCQIHGLKSFLSKNYDNLLTVDLICHGVPSPRVWEMYLSWLEDKNRAKVVNVLFRDKKKYGWSPTIETILLEQPNGHRVEINSKIFYSLFLGDNILRESCYVCPYKNLQRPGDITIGDFWGISNVFSGFNDNKGISMLIINNQKGEKLFAKCQDNAICYDVSIENRNTLSGLQASLNGQIEKKDTVLEFWEDWKKQSFEFLVDKYVVDRRENIPIDKFRQYYYVLNQWLILRQKNLNLAQYFIEKSYRNIAIYGIGELGVRLLEELRGTDVHISYVIDRTNSIHITKVQQIEPGDLPVKVDAIVVTPIFSFDQIEEYLKTICNCPVISLERIVFEML